LAARWIVKDLAQLRYSARDWRREEWELCLAEYAAQPGAPDAAKLFGRIERKLRAIARHDAHRG
jgi:hypothetical protein